MKCGIVGLPNVGKSTTFNALTKAGIAAENYPFCTIEPNIGIVEVPDPRMDQLAKIVVPQKVVPAIVEFVDIAGLVAGASKGEGLGNQFLATIRETDAISHVVRCFDDPNVIHVAGRVDPLSDIAVIDTELALADMQSVEKALHKAQKNSRAGDKEAIKLVAILEPMMKKLDQAIPVRAMGYDADELALIKQFSLLTAKPVLYVANVIEGGFENNPLLDRVKEHAAKEGAPVVAICAKIEAEIAELSDEDKQVFLDDIGMKEPGLARMIRAAYTLLGLETYFTKRQAERRRGLSLARSRVNDEQSLLTRGLRLALLKGFIAADHFLFVSQFCVGLRSHVSVPLGHSAIRVEFWTESAAGRKPSV